MGQGRSDLSFGAEGRGEGGTRDGEIGFEFWGKAEYGSVWDEVCSGCMMA